jgi:hypothetical protein
MSTTSCTPVIGGIRCSPDRHQLSTTLTGVPHHELNAQNFDAAWASAHFDRRFFLAPISFAFVFALLQGGTRRAR